MRVSRHFNLVLFLSLTTTRTGEYVPSFANICWY